MSKELLLTESQVKQLPTKSKRYKIGLADGFFVEVMPSGEKIYKARAETRTTTIGKSSVMTLQEAHERLEQTINELIHPELAEKTFTQVFEIWSEHKDWAWATRKKRDSIIKNYLQIFKKRKIKEIKRLEVLEVLRGIESQGKLETAHKALGILRQVFDYALICGYIDVNPATGLTKALKPLRNIPRAAITKESDITRLVQGISNYGNSPVVRSLLQFTMLTLCRPSECRLARWHEVENDIWTIPFDRMKLRKAHVVPLPHQCVQLLDNMRNFALAKMDDDLSMEEKLLKLQDRYIFPSHIPGRPLSDATLIKAIRIIGFSREQMSVHGFRSMGSTLLNEKGYRHDVIEKALAHAGEDRIRAIYNRAEYLNERRQMLQDYADYLDSLLINN